MQAAGKGGPQGSRELARLTGTVAICIRADKQTFVTAGWTQRGSPIWGTGMRSQSQASGVSAVSFPIPAFYASRPEAFYLLLSFPWKGVAISICYEFHLFLLGELIFQMERLHHAFF